MAVKYEEDECSICLNSLYEPKLLECFHSFCGKCLDDYIKTSAKDNTLQCPLCRHDIAVLNGEVKAFSFSADVDTDVRLIPMQKTTLHGYGTLSPKVREQIQNVNKDIQRTLTGNKSAKCEVCKIDVISNVKCRDCHKSLCNSCKAMHDQFSSCLELDMDEHFEISPEEKTDIGPINPASDCCPNHTNKGVEVYCTDCLVSVCSMCFLYNHNGHKFFDLQNPDIQQIIREDLDKLKQRLEMQIAKIQTFTNSLSVTLSELQDSADTACEMVVSQVEKICQEVRNRGEANITEIRKVCSVEKSKLEKLLVENKQFSDKLKFTVKKSLVALKDSSIVSVLHTISFAKKKDSEVNSRQLKIGDLRFPWFKQSKINKKVLSQQLGWLQNHREPTSVMIFNLSEALKKSKWN